jgi:membrane carboxypeptidase/penicillin-binding protein PbpC
MGLPLRITFNENDYVYQIINSKLINNTTTEIELLLNGEKLELVRDTNLIWKQKEGANEYDAHLIQALGRSVSLRLRM